MRSQSHRCATQVLKYLVTAGLPADIRTRDDGKTALHFAAAHGQNDVIRYFISNRSTINVNEQDKNGQTALHDAAWFVAHSLDPTP